VCKVSFGVRHGECFGLVGVEGGGRSTTLKMLTGEIVPSYGDAFLSIYHLRHDRNHLLKHMGYCPQSDAVVAFLTGREMLYLFARLRGVKNSEISRVVDNWLERFGNDNLNYV